MNTQSKIFYFELSRQWKIHFGILLCRIYNNSFANGKSLAEIRTDNLHTANKMLINHLQEIYPLRYGMRCKQDD